MRPIESAPFVNHNAPSGPDVIANDVLATIFLLLKMVITPPVVIRPIDCAPFVNHSAPSGPAAIAST